MFQNKLINSFYYRPQAAQIPIMAFYPCSIPVKPADEQDLASVSLQIDKKRFYVDIKRNKKGKFMKIAEVGIDGKKSRIILTMPAAYELQDRLKEILIALNDAQTAEECESSTDSGNQNDKSECDGIIKSCTIVIQKRRYFLDLKRNKRGYFLRIAMLTNNLRVQLAVPSEGIRELCDAISNLVDKWYEPSSTQAQQASQLPQTQILNADSRSYHFESFINREEQFFLRISELHATSKNSIAIPLKYMDQFQTTLGEFCSTLRSKEVELANDSNSGLVNRCDQEEKSDSSENTSPINNVDIAI